MLFTIQHSFSTCHLLCRRQKMARAIDVADEGRKCVLGLDSVQGCEKERDVHEPLVATPRRSLSLFRIVMAASACALRIAAKRMLSNASTLEHLVGEEGAYERALDSLRTLTPLSRTHRQVLIPILSNSSNILLDTNELISEFLHRGSHLFRFVRAIGFCHVDRARTLSCSRSSRRIIDSTCDRRKRELLGHGCCVRIA